MTEKRRHLETEAATNASPQKGMLTYMSFSHVYSVPAYYPNFRCKAGDCRHPCCTGWDIAISMKEYFRMLGLDCSFDLRRRLDTAFHLADTPSDDRYAIISRRWDGDCPLHLPNGLCGLQCECGEDAIPSVCRYYPRSPKTHYAYQCQCSNSCEAVVEMLFDYREPMTFVRRKLTFDFSESIPHTSDRLSKLFPQVQRACLRILQNRSLTLSQRLIHLGELIQVMDIPYREGNVEGIHAVLPFSATPPKAVDGKYVQATQSSILKAVLAHVRDLLYWLKENNVSLQNLAEEAINALSLSLDAPITEETVSLWCRYAQEMAQRFPDNDRMLEQIFVNHLCYDSFPFSDDRHHFWGSFLSLCTAYALVRVLSVCHLAVYRETESEQTLTPIQAYADIVATSFRVVEHTNFTHNAVILAHRFSFDLPDQAFPLCYL